MKKSSPQFLLLCTVALLCVAATADDPHPHRPILVPSRPVIERVPLSVIDPIDVTITEFGDTLVADAGGKMLFRVTTDGIANVLGKNLTGISRVVDSRQLGPHALLTDQKSSRVLRFTDSGMQQTVINFAFRAFGLAIDPDNNLITSSGKTGIIYHVDDENTLTRLVQLSEPVLDLATDRLGNVFVLLQSGQVISVTGKDASAPVGFLPKGTTRIKIHPDDYAVGLTTGEQRPILNRINKTSKPLQFAGTAMGTSAFAFDGLGNLVLTNPDLRAVTRVKSRFVVNCSHPNCDHPVHMILTPNAVPQHRRRSF